MHGSRFLLVPVILFLIGGVIIACTTRQSVHSQVPDEVVKLLFELTCTKGCSDEEVALWKTNLKSEMHDLNGDSVPEWFLYIDHSDWCGAGGRRCDYWVVQKGKDAYALILNSKELRVEEAVTNGYRDLTSVMPGGFDCDGDAQRVYITPYKFDGRRYVERPTLEDCVSAS